MIILALAAALALQAISDFPAPQPPSAALPLSAKEQLDRLRADLKRAHASNDAQAYLSNAVKMREFLNGSPASLLQLMGAESFSGDYAAALHTFEEFVRMGQSNADAIQLPQFEQLRKDPRFVPIDARMLSNTSAVSRATQLISLVDPGLIPEDIDYDPATKLFYITSVLEKKILAVDMSGATRTFAQTPDHWPMMALKIDHQRQTLWATEVALNDFEAAPKNDWGRSAILLYDLRTGKLLHRIEGPAHSALGDMTLSAKGDAIVSDGENGGVYRIDRKSLQIDRLDNGEFISPQTPALSPDGKSIFIPDYLRGIGILNLDTRRVTWIPVSGVHALSGHAVSGIDGLYLDGRTLIATQNGTSPERVIEFVLDPSLLRIESETILERATPTLGDPTHGVVIGSDFYYIANSGWDSLDDHGARNPGSHPSSPLLMKASLHN